MRIIALIVVAAALHTAAFAQKPEDPEARNKRAVSVAQPRLTPSRVRVEANSEPHRSPDHTSVRKSASSTARDLAKIERTSVQQMKATHKAKNTSKAAPPALPGDRPQSKKKPINFSYQRPQAANKTSVKNPQPAPVRSRPTH